MLLMLTLAAALAAADPAPVAEPPPPAPTAKPAKAPPVCTSRKVGRLFGHDVTHLKCEDAKPAPAKPPSDPA